MYPSGGRKQCRVIESQWRSPLPPGDFVNVLYTASRCLARLGDRLQLLESGPRGILHHSISFAHGDSRHLES